MTKDFRKQPIYLHLREYQNDLRLFNMDNSKRSEIKEFYFKTTNKELKDFKNVASQLYKFVEDSVTDNFMNLPIKKYCELKGISFQNIQMLEDSIDTWTEPNLESYTTYTNSEVANERLKDFQELKKAFNKFASKYDVNKNQLNHALRNVAFYCQQTNDVFANPEFINRK